MEKVKINKALLCKECPEYLCGLCKKFDFMTRHNNRYRPHKSCIKKAMKKLKADKKIKQKQLSLF